MVWLAEASDPRWRATVAGARLDRVRAGWGNGFALPARLVGPLVVAFPYQGGVVAVWILVALGWVAFAGAATERSERVSRTRVLR